MTRTDTARREIGAPPATVFAALIDPAALVVWLPPAGMTGRIDHFDLRPGGTYRMVLTYDDPAVAGKSGGGADVVEARFVAIEPGLRVVQAVEFASDDPAMAGTMTMTWTVSPTATGSAVEIRAEDVPDGISAEDHAEGMASSLANLARYVEHGPRPTT